MSLPNGYGKAFENVLVDFAANVGWVTLNRPKKRNAIGPALSAEMLQVLRLLNDDPEVRVIVLTGAGNSFCAGMDLSFFGQLADEQTELANFYADARGWNTHRPRNPTHRSRQTDENRAAQRRGISRAHVGPL